MSPHSSPHRHSPAIRILLGWIDSNELLWTFPLPPWCPPRVRALRRLRMLARQRLREERITLQGWPRTLTQALVWPLMAGVKALRSLREYPVGHNSGPWAHMQEAAKRWWLQVAHNIRISDQSDLYLHLPAHRSRATAFITCRENQALLNLARLRIQGFPDLDLKNPFARFCAEHQLPTAAALMTGQGPRVLSARTLPRADMFLKLADGGKGRGAEVLPRASNADAWIGHGGVQLTESDLAAYVHRRLGDQPWILQERLQNAPSWAGYTPAALATVRVVTARPQPAGPPECLTAYLRLPRKNAMVDNLSAGGLGTPVDLATGKLGPARDWIDVLKHHDHHPDTGAQINGMLLPGWPEILELSLRAHSAAGEWLAIGWDVSMTTAGPVLIEANLNWAMTPFFTIEDSRFIEVMNSLFFPAK